MENKKLAEFLSYVKNKKTTVIGIGISNLPLIKYLCENGAKVTACDKRDEKQLGNTCLELKNMGVELNLGEDYLKNIDGEIIFKTPGMRYDVKELLEAVKKGAKLTSEMEVFFDVCPCKIIAVTGSDGKTTTTTLISKILEQYGYKTWLGGNIGNPLLTSTKDMKKDDIVVLELSSFQLHTMKKSPHIAVMTNITPNHLDMHKSYEEYIDAKKNIMKYQNPDDLLIVNSGNEKTFEIAKESNARVLGFSSKEEQDIYIKDNFICYREKKVLDIGKIKLLGAHNVENYMAAIGAIYEMVDEKAILKVAQSFGGVEHRIELVREFEGVKYYNSSIDSSPNRTINTLGVFDKKVIMIAGGKDKGISYDEIGLTILDNVKVLILIGATADAIYDATIKESQKRNTTTLPKIIRVKTYDEAVSKARENAKPKDVVLLSPASTSFDMFKNFEERGKLFKSLVNELK